MIDWEVIRPNLRIILASLVVNYQIQVLILREMCAWRELQRPLMGRSLGIVLNVWFLKAAIAVGAHFIVIQILGFGVIAWGVTCLLIWPFLAASIYADLIEDFTFRQGLQIYIVQFLTADLLCALFNYFW